MKSRRISKAEHVERMGYRAARRARDAGYLTRGPEPYEGIRARAERARNGVGRPPRT